MPGGTEAKQMVGRGNGTGRGPRTSHGGSPPPVWAGIAIACGARADNMGDQGDWRFGDCWRWHTAPLLQPSVLNDSREENYVVLQKGVTALPFKMWVRDPGSGGEPRSGHPPPNPNATIWPSVVLASHPI